jgi:hypothetical protein
MIAKSKLFFGGALHCPDMDSQGRNGQRPRKNTSVRFHMTRQTEQLANRSDLRGNNRCCVLGYADIFTSQPAGDRLLESGTWFARIR